MKKYLYALATDQIDTLPARILKFILLLCSYGYGLAVMLILSRHRNGKNRKYVLPKPVISIGNITLGGVGKTPFVETVARFLLEKKIKPVVLSRGYGAVKAQRMNDELSHSDEAGVLMESLPEVKIYEGKDKFKTGQTVLREQGDVGTFVLDDGFQHWRLKRDLDIVLIDADKPFGNGYLIPRGILRESVKHLRRADIFVLTKTDLGKRNLESLRDRLSQIKPGCLIVETVHEPADLSDRRHTSVKKELDFLRGKKVCSFCGIGDPKSFAYLLSNLGANVKKDFVFMDHHVYQEADINAMVAFCRENRINTVVTTQKDAVKLKSYLALFPPDMAVLSLNIKVKIVKGQDEFFRRISDLYRR